MASFDEFANAVTRGAKELAKDIFDGFESDAGEDAKAFLAKTQEDIQRWIRLLSKGELTEQDFSDLVQAKQALAELHLLRQKGVTQTRLERFRIGLISLVVDTAVDLFL